MTLVFLSSLGSVPGEKNLSAVLLPRLNTGKELPRIVPNFLEVHKFHPYFAAPSFTTKTKLTKCFALHSMANKVPWSAKFISTKHHNQINHKKSCSLKIWKHIYHRLNLSFAYKKYLDSTLVLTTDHCLCFPAGSVHYYQNLCATERSLRRSLP